MMDRHSPFLDYQQRTRRRGTIQRLISRASTGILCCRRGLRRSLLVGIGHVLVNFAINLLLHCDPQPKALVVWKNAREGDAHTESNRTYLDEIPLKGLSQCFYTQLSPFS